MNQDNAIVNVLLSKRGDIDAYKVALAKAETIERTRSGVKHLFKGGMLRVFANRSQAETAAARTGGEAYQSTQSNRFLVRYAAGEVAA